MIEQLSEEVNQEIKHSWDTVPTSVVVDVDRQIAPLVTVMNILGWRTHYSCSGHPWSAIDTRAYVGVWWREKRREIHPGSSRTLSGDEFLSTMERLRGFLAEALGPTVDGNWELQQSPPQILLKQELIGKLTLAFVENDFRPPSEP